MKAIFEIYVPEINIITVNDVLCTIKANKNITNVLYYFCSNDSSHASNKSIYLFFNYMRKKLPLIQAEYVITSHMDKFLDMVLFSSNLCKENFVHKDSISLIDMTQSIARTLLLYVPADMYYFYIDKPAYNGQNIQFVSSELFTKSVDVYGKIATDGNFNGFISHTPISQDLIQYLKSIDCIDNANYVGHYDNLRTKLIQQNNEFFNGSYFKMESDSSTQIGQAIYKQLLVYNNF